VQQFENGDWKPFMYEGKVMEASQSSAFIVVKTREEMKQDVDNSVQVAEQESEKIVVKEEKAEEIKQEAVKTIDEVVAVADSAANTLKDGCEKCTEAGKDSVTTIIKDLKEDIKDEAQEAKNKIDQIVTKALADVNARIEQAKADVNTNANSTKSLIDNDANVCEREILAKKQVLAMGINQLCNSNYTSNYNPYNNGRDNNYSNYKTLNLDNRSYYIDCSNSDSEIKKSLKNQPTKSIEIISKSVLHVAPKLLSKIRLLWTKLSKIVMQSWQQRLVPLKMLLSN
jgi:protein-tyrosine-phosphatase